MHGFAGGNRPPTQLWTGRNGVDANQNRGLDWFALTLSSPFALSRVAIGVIGRHLNCGNPPLSYLKLQRF